MAAEAGQVEGSERLERFSKDVSNIASRFADRSESQSIESLAEMITGWMLLRKDLPREDDPQRLFSNPSQSSF